MNYIVVVLGIIIILLVFILIRFLSDAATELTASANLNDEISGLKISNNPTSTRYAYGIWVYVNSWDMGANKTLFERTDNIKVYLDPSSPVLKCDMKLNDGTTKTIEITDNFPVQKWVHIIVSVDNQYVDCYIDGKLVRSGRVYIENDSGIVIPNTPPDVNTLMHLGKGSKYDAYVSRFKHWSSAINPETAWSTYLKGNGQTKMKNWMSSYGLDVLIKKDNLEQTKFSLF